MQVLTLLWFSVVIFGKNVFLLFALLLSFLLFFSFLLQQCDGIKLGKARHVSPLNVKPLVVGNLRQSRSEPPTTNHF